MRRKVYYMSQRGPAEAVAVAIARVAGCQPEPLLPAYMPENVDLMFLGCEGDRADKVTLSFIDSLNPNRVRRAALFQCASPRGEAANQMRAALVARGIAVADRVFTAPNKNLFGRGGPAQTDLDAARAFAKAAIEQP